MDKFSVWDPCDINANEYTCKKCGCLASDSHAVIVQPAKYVIACLKSFEYGQSAAVRVNTPVFGRSDVTINTLVYTRIAELNHMGSAVGGHYTTCVLNKDLWYNCNDGIVTKTNLDAINGGTGVDPYVIVYKRSPEVPVEPGPPIVVASASPASPASPMVSPPPWRSAGVVRLSRLQALRLRIPCRSGGRCRRHARRGAQ